VVAGKNDEADNISMGGSITNGQQDYPIKNSDQYNWGSAKIAYLGPDDARLIRTEVIYD